MIDIGRDYVAYIAGGVVVAISVAVIIRRKWVRQEDYPNDVVILHQIRRGMWAPSISPFALKFETYLRMAKIPYKNDLELKFSSKGKFPWMTYNGVDIADTQFCIEYLNDKLDKDLNKHLTPEEQAVARAFQRLTEENLFWVVAMWYWCIDWTMMKQLLKYVRTAFLVLPYTSRLIKRNAWGHGIGRHSIDEILHIARTDFTALSTYLGDKEFFMGSSPSEVDATVFGLMAQFKWHLPDTPPGKIMKEFTNLSAYCDRMKERFWPDWDDCITHGNTRVAIK